MRSLRYGNEARAAIPCRLPLEGCIQILQLRKLSLAFGERCSPTPWEHIITESVLFNSATTALFDPDVASIYVPNLRDILQPFLSGSSIPGCSSVASSPVLRIPSEIFFVLLEVSQLFHWMPLSSLGYVEALRLEDRLGELHAQCPSNPDLIDERYSVSKNTPSAQPHIVAARILLHKILRPDHPTLGRCLGIASELCHGHHP